MPAAPKPLDFFCPQTGAIKLLVARPDEHAWGGFSAFYGTPWAGLIRVITGEALSHAYHGWYEPLLRELGPNPHTLGKRLPAKDADCQSRCLGWNPAVCRVGGVGLRKIDPLGPPDCFSTGIPNGELVALAIREHRHPVVVCGAEFNLA